MNCRECEVALGMEELSAEVEEHLAGCAECRGLAGEIRSNSAAFEAMENEELPGVRGGVMARIQRRRVLRWGWALAAAAAVVLMIGVSRSWREEKIVTPPEKVAGGRVDEGRSLLKRGTDSSVPSGKRFVSRRRVAGDRVVSPPFQQTPKSQTLMVKMLTDDPDVVIYWEIGTKEGSE
jgi:hypothetical protein